MGGNANVAINFRKYNLIITSSNINKSMIAGAIFVVLVVIILYWFFGTQLGSAIRATGCNEAMARANGINTNRNKVFGLVLSNGIVALAGALEAQYSGNADIGKGKGAIVIGLAAVIIGEVIFGKIFKNFALRLVGVALGGVIYYIVQTVVIQLGLDPNDLKLFTALFVAVFLGLPYWKSKMKPSVKKQAKKNGEVGANA